MKWFRRKSNPYSGAETANAEKAEPLSSGERVPPPAAEPAPVAEPSYTELKDDEKSFADSVGQGGSPVFVHVTAPADLPAGYTFEATVNGDYTRVFTAEVPEGGVKEGQVFLAPIPASVQGPHLNIPSGAWKDSLWSFCSLGPLHKHLWCAICCPQILMAQVMMRMQFTWLGEPGQLVSTRNTFRVVAVIVGSYLVYSTALEVASWPYDFDSVPSFIPVLRFLGSFMFSLWGLVALCKTRENTRAAYSIPEEQCVGCEDCCCSFFCTCCTVAQLARHTGEYETYPATCLTSTGHPEDTPLAV